MYFQIKEVFGWKVEVFHVSTQSYIFPTHGHIWGGDNKADNPALGAEQGMMDVIFDYPSKSCEVA